MTACLVAERSPRYGSLEAREPPGSLDLFLLRPAGLPPPAWPRAELYVLPARLFLDLEPGRRPAPAFAYGGLAFAAESLAAGALDYLLEPWELPELEARARGRLAPPLRLGSLGLDPGSRLLSSPRGRVRLSEAECLALRLFALASDGLVTREALAYALWGRVRPGSRATDVLVSALRRRLSALAAPGELEIRALRGRGYRLLRGACE